MLRMFMEVASQLSLHSFRNAQAFYQARGPLCIEIGVSTSPSNQSDFNFYWMQVNLRSVFQFQVEPVANSRYLTHKGRQYESPECHERTPLQELGLFSCIDQV